MIKRFAVVLALCTGLAFAQGVGPQSASLSASNACASIAVDPRQTASVDILVTGTWATTLTPKIGVNGNTPVATSVYPQGSTTSQSTITANGDYTAVQIAGHDFFEVCFTSYSSGTAVVTLSASVATALNNIGGGGGGGDTVSSPNSTLNVGGTSTSTTLDVNLANANSWTALQTFGTHISIGGQTLSGGVQGTGDTKALLAGTVSGTGATLCTDSNGGATTSGCSGGSSAFSALTSSTNTTAAMVVGTGASLGVSGTGSISATTLTGGSTNDLVYQTGSGTTGFISPVDSAVLVTSASGVPSESATLPSGLALQTPTSGVITNLTGTCTNCGSNTVDSAASTTNSSFSILAGSATSGQQEPSTIASFTINPSTGQVNIPGSLTVASCSGCGSVSLAFPLTVSGTTTSGHLPYFSNATTLSNDSNLDDGATTASTLTYAGSGGITASAGPLASGVPSGGVGSSLFLKQEGTIPSGLSTSGQDNCYADSTQHGLLCNFNAGTTLPLVQGPASDTSGALSAFSGTNGGKLVAATATNLGTLAAIAQYDVVVSGGTSAALAGVAPSSSTGQVFTSNGASSNPGYNDLWLPMFIPSANCNNTTAGAGWSIPSGGTVTCRAGTNNLGGYITITDTSSTFAQFMVVIPFDWDTASNPYIRTYFSSASDTTSGHTVIPQVKVSCSQAVNGTTTDDQTFTSAQSLSTTTFGASAIANGIYSGSNVQFGSTQMSGCVAGGLFIVQVGRATDTATGNINFYGASLTWPHKTPGVAGAN